jgi:glycine C-acetyltransferase
MPTAVRGQGNQHFTTGEWTCVRGRRLTDDPARQTSVRSWTQTWLSRETNMAYPAVAKERWLAELAAIREKGLFKDERFIHSPQAAHISVEYPSGSGLKDVINLCANNYLGLSSHPAVVAAAHKALDERGYGMSSVRFICGTQDVHRTLEQKLTTFLGTEDTILFASCLDANAGVFEAIFGPDDVLISDRLVHASIVDGIRLCKAMHDTYKHCDMAHLEQKLREYQDRRIRVIITDGVFSMDGDMAPLDQICALAESYGALVFLDDSHATGFIGKSGRGVHEHFGVMGKVDIITTTLGKALGGASGGCVSGRKEIVELCRQRARPYLFSNAVPPPIAAAAISVLDLLSESTERRDKLATNAAFWRKGLIDAGFVIREGASPIVPVMLFNAKLAQAVARDLYDEGVYVVGFFFPVVPAGLARIRTQLSADHDIPMLGGALQSFEKIGAKYGILGLDKNGILEKYGQ